MQRDIRQRQMAANDPLRSGLRWEEMDSFTLTRPDMDALLEAADALEVVVEVWDIDHAGETEPSWMTRARTALKRD